MTWLRVRTGVAVFAAVVSVTACGSPPAPPAPTAKVRGPVAGDLIGPPTTLQSATAVSMLAAKSVRIRYRSTSPADGSPTTVSGAVFVPKGDPPVGGWPIVAIGHPTVGINTACAPSGSPGLMGNLPVIIGFLTLRYVVVMTDYQGLGTPGPHPYLDPTTAAYNIIDSVRAAHGVAEQTSNSWAAYGISQGGQAVWAANERSADYGRGLQLIGSISVSAPTDLRPFVDAMQNGTLTVAQRAVLPLILMGIQVTHPELNLDDYLHGVMRSRLDVFLACAGDQEDTKGAVAESATPEDTMPVDAAAADRLRGWLGELSVPQRRASAPMLVAYGDEDTLVLPAWTRTGIGQACELGDVVDVHEVAGQGHGDLNLGVLPGDWLADRRAGVSAPNSCVPQ